MTISNSVYPEIWINEVAENLFIGNPHINLARADDDKVNYTTVHLPQAGAAPTILRNNHSYPLAPGQRTDILLSYSIDEFKTSPAQVENLEIVQSSYDKRAEMMYEHQAVLNQEIGSWMIFNWIYNSILGSGVPAARVIYTDGVRLDTNGNQLAPAKTAATGSGTGSRLIFTVGMFAQAKLQMDNDLIPAEDRYCLLSPNDMSELTQNATVLNSLYLNQVGMEKGEITSLFGFKIIQRAYVARADNSGAPGSAPAYINPDAAGSATDNRVVVFFHKMFVRRAIGAIKMFFNPDRVDYTGDIFNFLVRAGGSSAYTNFRGIVVCVQTAA